ncbi:hypothetical protein GCM10009650_06770 [Nesterenkonia jeotgali]
MVRSGSCRGSQLMLKFVWLPDVIRILKSDEVPSRRRNTNVTRMVRTTAGFQPDNSQTSGGNTSGFEASRDGDSGPVVYNDDLKWLDRLAED